LLGAPLLHCTEQTTLCLSRLVPLVPYHHYPPGCLWSEATHAPHDQVSALHTPPQYFTRICPSASISAVGSHGLCLLARPHSVAIAIHYGHAWLTVSALSNSNTEPLPTSFLHQTHSPTRRVRSSDQPSFTHQSVTSNTQTGLSFGPHHTTWSKKQKSGLSSDPSSEYSSFWLSLSPFSFAGNGIKEEYEAFHSAL
jgi:hypothetical protein